MKMGNLIIVSVVLGVVTIGGYITYKDRALKKEQAESEQIAKITLENDKESKIVELKGVLFYLNELGDGNIKAQSAVNLAISSMQVDSITKSETSGLPKAINVMREVKKLVEIIPDKGCVVPPKQSLLNGMSLAIEGFDLVALSQGVAAREKLTEANNRFREYSELYKSCLKATTDELNSLH
ncbi:hypothetical protein [Aquitalea pelogenes]|uniref:hypothetical protein n=1 Tax=Aquitalea pelogenes TaxID=1293573 RepID=UPI0007889A57|nr:hypothetical protein [Aquitalea pelogenes]